MPTSLAFDDHIAVLREQGTRFAELAEATDLAAPVPTCPGWDLRTLIAHQGEVHRWATDVVAGRWDELTDAEQQERVAAPANAVLSDWLHAGVDDLVTTLEEAPDDLHAPVFLHDSPDPRRFWARRQAHETTVHRVDALAASLGRVPTSAEAAIESKFAADGIDELVSGFLPRRKSRLRSDPSHTLAVEPTDVRRRWLLTISNDPLVTVESPAPAASTFRGRADQLYLGLWNRGGEFEVAGDAEVLPLWRTTAVITWE
jgi:uncharacterized protein (TIGR03083 family)